MRLRRGWWGALVALALVAGCAINPVTGERELVLMSAEQEAATGRQAAEQVEREIGLLESPALESYVAAIGGRLAGFSPRQDVQYSFRVVTMPETNAFALPGGYVYVSRGLLALANTEDELANVIAHEIGHVAARHHAQRQTRATTVGLASILGTIAAGVLGGADAAQAVGQVAQVAGAGLIASYGRDQERQSDRIGQQMAADAGWDPAAMAEFLRRLELETRLRTGKERMPTFLDSHPSTPERIGAAAALARTLPRRQVAPIAPSKADFLRRLDGLLLGPDPAEGLFQGEVFLHPQLDFQLRFPAGWQTQNSPTAVAARAPDGSGMVQLVGQGRGNDARQAADRFAASAEIQLASTGPVRISGLRAWRGRARVASQSGNLIVELTWIPYRDMIYRIEAVSSESGFGRLEALFHRVATSFRPLTGRERSSIRERRLAVVTARRGETLATLGPRTGNVWTVHETAVMNGMSEVDRLASGQPVKIARERPWSP